MTASLHLNLPPSNQELIDKTKSPPYCFFTNVCQNLEEKICHYFDYITTLNSCYAASEAVQKKTL